MTEKLLLADLRALLTDLPPPPLMRLANGPVSVRFDGSVLRIMDQGGLMLEVFECRQIAVQMPQFPLELFEIPEERKS